jgi:multidrug efflux system membrane fusion protein
MPSLSKKRGIIAVAAILAGIGAAAYGLQVTVASKGPAKAASARPAVPVETVKMEKAPLRVWRSFPARLVAVDEVELRPQVSGRIVDVRFRDGQTVGKGDVLFVIDPRPFEAAMQQAKADLSAAKERRAFAERELARARKLIRTNAVAKRVVDERENEFANATSAVDSAAAQVLKAEIDLDHAYVKAPISGRVSRVEVTAGNLVQTGSDAPLLTSIVSDRGIYADFDVDENTYLRNVHSADTTSDGDRNIPVQLLIGSNGSEMYEGHIYAFDNRIDPATGTIRARALFSNADGTLLPGMFARLKMGSAEKRDAMLLTERAILTDQDRKYVYVVNKDSKATYREVQLGASADGKRIIEKGLEPGEQVIVGGLMVVRPNVPVAPKSASPAKDGAAKQAGETKPTPDAPSKVAGK